MTFVISISFYKHFAIIDYHSLLVDVNVYLEIEVLVCFELLVIVIHLGEEIVILVYDGVSGFITQESLALTYGMGLGVGMLGAACLTICSRLKRSCLNRNCFYYVDFFLLNVEGRVRRCRMTFYQV